MGKVSINLEKEAKMINKYLKNLIKAFGIFMVLIYLCCNGQPKQNPPGYSDALIVLPK